jgi:hypothetical protein
MEQHNLQEILPPRMPGNLCKSGRREMLMLLTVGGTNNGLSTASQKSRHSKWIIRTYRAEELNDMLMANITVLCSSPETALRPARRDPLCSGMNFPLSPLPSSPNASRTPRPPSTEEKKKLVGEACQTVFDLYDNPSPTTPYFDKYPIACAYGLQKFFAERNYTITVDELIRNPRIEDQLSLLAQSRSRCSGVESI